MPYQQNENLVNKLLEFLNQYYRNDIGRLAQKYPSEQRSLYIDHNDIFRFDPDLADDVLDHPAEMVEYFEEALRLYDLPIDVTLDDAHVRFENLPTESQYEVGETRADDREQLVTLHGQISKRSTVKPKVKQAAFECQRCGSLTRIPQNDTELQEPHECSSCERQGPFRINFDQSTLIDHQLIRLQQPPEQTKGGQGEHIDVTLEDDLVEQIDAGDRVYIDGILQLDETDTDSVTFDPYFSGQSIRVEQTDYEDIDTEEYEDEIHAIADGEFGDPLDVFVDSLAPKINGYHDIKRALILQLFGGTSVQYPDGARDRGDFHILLLGDPGCGKSTMLRAVETIAPRSTYASGKGASAAGMTAAAVKDDFGDTEWGLEAGALVLADKGIACVDEIDKIKEDAVSSLHDALESQQVNVSKAGITAELPARTALLAAGNPKYGRFDQYEPVGEQIDLDAALISRFDLMFMLTDEPDIDKDEDDAHHILGTRRLANEYTYGDANSDELDAINPVVDAELLRAYIAYAKQEYTPKIPEHRQEKIVEWYVQLRQANDAQDDAPVPVTARKIEAMARLAEASARARLSNVVEDQDLELAGDLVMQSMRNVGVDPETGQFDADVVETGTSKSQRDRMKNLKNIIEEIAQEYNNGAPKAEIIDYAMDLDMGKNQTEHSLEQLAQRGDIYETQEDHYRTS